ncbi:MAG: bacterial Ig-like domain-containing protein [Clostridia bacterium]|nr:bacterial Ig-like domain-containing protein [Clostridia bacterium]
MKLTKKILFFLLSAILVASVAVFAASCSGGYAPRSVSVDGTSVKTEYEVGEKVDFSGVKVTVTFTDDSKEIFGFNDVELYFGNEKLEAETDKITAEKGRKEIKVKYKEVETSIVINVVSAAEPIEEDNRYVLSFTYEEETNRAKKAAETNIEYGQNGYEGQFYASEDVVRLVGDDNAFELKPILTLFDPEEIKDEVVDRYESEANISIVNEDGSKEGLAIDKDEENATARYYSGETLYATAFYAEQKYKFEEVSIGKKIEISVLPLGYKIAKTVEPFAITVKIVDGYNVYSAAQLSVVDNTQQSDWADIKNANGLLNVDPDAVVLQNNIAIAASDLPSSFVYELTDAGKAIDYYNNSDLTTPIASEKEKLGVYRIKDCVDVYKRNTADGKTFSFYGNFYTLNAQSVPLVSSFADGENRDYESDFSNTTLFKFTGNGNSENKGSYELSNINVIGNANRSELVDGTAKHNPVYAGGLIFLKINNADSKINNALLRTFFISVFPEESGKTEIENIKCYDSYQNAGFFWSGVECSIKNSDIKRAGGPLFIMQHVEPKTSGYENRIPKLTVEDSNLESLVTGQEVWFVSVKATEAFSLLTTLDAPLKDFGKTIMNTDGERTNLVNVVCLVMANGSDASVLSDPAAQGYFSNKKGEKTYYIDRLYAASEFGGQLLQAVMKYQSAVLNTDDSGFIGLPQNDDGEYVPTIYPENDLAVAMAVQTSLASSDFITVNLGGMGIMLGLGNVAA